MPFYVIFQILLTGINEGSSYKSKKLQTLKAESQSAHNWNTLFLGSNAVAETIASNYNISKEQVQYWHNFHLFLPTALTAKRVSLCSIC